jgi:hypothetical protein
MFGTLSEAYHRDTEAQRNLKPIHFILCVSVVSHFLESIVTKSSDTKLTHKSLPP